MSADHLEGRGEHRPVSVEDEFGADVYCLFDGDDWPCRGVLEPANNTSRSDGAS